MGKRVTLFTSSRKTENAVTRALVSVGYTVTIKTLTAFESEDLSRKKADMLLIDIENFSNTEKLIKHVSTSASSLPLSLLSKDLGDPKLVDLLVKEGINNLISNRGSFQASQSEIDERELITTCQKLLSQEIFGLEKYLRIPNALIHETRIASNFQYPSAQKEMDNLLARLNCARPVAQMISLVVDELITNAIYDAPRDEKGHPKYKGNDRTQELHLSEKEQVTLRYACDGQNFLLSVSDNFGSLERDIIMHYLEQSFVTEPEINPPPQGAGLGLHMIFNSINRLVFNIEEGKKTEVIAGFYIGSGMRAFKDTGRTLNIFLIK